MITPEEFAAAWTKLEQEAPVLRQLRAEGHPQTLDTLPEHLREEALQRMGFERVYSGTVLLGLRRVEAS